LGIDHGGARRKRGENQAFNKKSNAPPRVQEREKNGRRQSGAKKRMKLSAERGSFKNPNKEDRLAKMKRTAKREIAI